MSTQDKKTDESWKDELSNDLVAVVGNGLSYFKETNDKNSPEHNNGSHHYKSFEAYFLQKKGSNKATLDEVLLEDDTLEGDVSAEFGPDNNKEWKNRDFKYLRSLAKISQIKTYFTFARDGMLEAVLRKCRVGEKVYSVNYIGYQSRIDAEQPKIGRSDVCIVYMLGKFGTYQIPKGQNGSADVAIRQDMAFEALSKLIVESSQLPQSDVTNFPQFVRSRLENKQMLCFGLDVKDWKLMHFLRAVDFDIYTGEKRQVKPTSCVVQSTKMQFPNGAYETKLHEKKRSVHIYRGTEENDLIETILNFLSKKRDDKDEEQDDKYDCFLCHSSKDKDLIEQVVEKLEQYGIKCWFDKNNLRTGGPLHGDIEKGIDNSKAFVPFVTKNLLADGKGQSFALDLEWHHFLGKKKSSLVIPVYSRNVLLKDASDLFIKVLQGQFGNHLDAKVFEYWSNSQHHWFRQVLILLEEVLDDSNTHTLVDMIETKTGE